MEISRQQFDEWVEAQVGQPCKEHGSIIKKGKWGNWCGQRTELGTYCTGNKYPNPNNEALTIKS